MHCSPVEILHSGKDCYAFTVSATPTVPPTVPGLIRVRPTVDSVTVMWDAPQFFGSVHG